MTTCQKTFTNSGPKAGGGGDDSQMLMSHRPTVAAVCFALASRAASCVGVE